MSLGGRPRLYGRTRGLRPDPCPMCGHEAWQHATCNECNGPTHALCTAMRPDPKLKTRYVACHCTWAPGQPKQETIIVDEEKTFINIETISPHEARAVLETFSAFVEFAELYETRSAEAIALENGETHHDRTIEPSVDSRAAQRDGGAPDSQEESAGAAPEPESGATERAPEYD